MQSVEAAFRFRFYPTQEQSDVLARTFGCVRVVYNRARAAREEAWTQRKERCGFLQTSAWLTEWKKLPELTWLNEVSSVPLQQALRHLDRAYANFFRKTARYPGWRHKDGPQSAEFTKSGFNWKPGRLTLAKMREPLNVVWSRDLPSPPSTVTVTRETDGHWYVSCRVLHQAEELTGGGEAIGIDLGLTHFATLSTGEKIDNPRHLAKAQKRIARLQRRMARKKKGSNNRRKARLKVARALTKVRNARADFLHKLSTRLVRENQVIAVETLSVKGMLRAKLHSRSIADVAWGEFVRMLAYKCGWRGRRLVRIGRWEPSTRTCSACGCLHTLTLADREWSCSDCGSKHDRDHNAAKNILAAGQAVTARGENGSPGMLRHSGQSSVKRESAPQGPGILAL